MTGQQCPSDSNLQSLKASLEAAQRGVAADGVSATIQAINDGRRLSWKCIRMRPTRRVLLHGGSCSVLQADDTVRHICNM